jgi:hypothetical protein
MFKYKGVPNRIIYTLVVNIVNVVFRNMEALWNGLSPTYVKALITQFLLRLLLNFLSLAYPPLSLSY